jgi:hypothetical protein
MVQGGLIDKAIEVLCELACDFGRSPRARAVHQTLGALGGKAVNPFAEGGIGKVERVGDRLEALPGDDGTDRLSTTEYPGFFRLF